MKRFFSFIVIVSLVLTSSFSFSVKAFARDASAEMSATTDAVAPVAPVAPAAPTLDTSIEPSLLPTDVPVLAPSVDSTLLPLDSLVQPSIVDDSVSTQSVTPEVGTDTSVVVPQVDIPQEIIDQGSINDPALSDTTTSPSDPPVDDPNQPKGMVAADNLPPTDEPPFIPKDNNAPVRPKTFTITDRDFVEQQFVNLFSGAANVQLPLHLPSGINGLTPDLTLSYNSQLVNENGPYGFGWEMELGQIKRLNKSGVAKMYSDPVYHITLGSLSGEMIKLSENSGVSEYALRREQGFAKVFYYINNNNWEVVTKDGSHYFLGTSAQSKVVDETGSKVFSWQLEKMQDANGNSMSYEYARIGNTLYPKKIKYGGAGTSAHPFEVRFQPFADNANPSENRGDVRSDYNKGFKTEYTHVIDKIEVYFQNDKKLTYDLGYADRKLQERIDLNELKVIGKSPDDGKEVTQAMKFTYFDIEDGFTKSQLYQRHKYLRSIKFQQGGEISYDYKSSKTFFDNSGKMSNRHPYFPLYVVNSLTRKDLDNTTSTTNYYYSDGHFFFDSPVEKEVAGFGRVTVTDPVNQSNVYYFHQGGGYDGSSLGENPDDDWSLIGRMYRSEVYDKNSKLVQKNISRWMTKNLSNKRNFIYEAAAVNTLLDGAAPKSSAEESVYDFSNGNVLSKTSYGEVTATNNGYFTDIESDKRKTVYTYAQNTGKNLLAYVSSQKSYDNANNLVQQSSYLYDNLGDGQVNKGNLTQQTNYLFAPAKEIKTKYEYNSYGQVTKVINALGRNVQLTYDNYSLYPSKVTNHLGQATNFEYEYIFGSVKKSTDANGLITQSKFDGLGRQIEQLYSSPADKTKLVTMAKTTYLETSLPNSVEGEVFFDNNVSSKQKSYLDGFGRTIQQKSQSENANSFVTVDSFYNKLGQNEKQSLPYFSNTISKTAATTDAKLYTTLTYDVFGRVLESKNVIGTTKNTYSGRDLTVMDAKGKAKNFQYDVYGNLIKVEELNGAEKYVTQYTYSPLNKLTQIKDAKGNMRTFYYDSLGRLTQQDDLHAPADTTFAVWHYEYDDNGNVAKLIRPDGTTIQYGYDELDRFVFEDFAGEAGQEVVYVYDQGANAIGKLSTVTKKDFSVTYTYNIRGNVAEEQKTLDGQTYKTTYNYDLQNRPVESTLPDSSVVQNTYNLAGQVEKVMKKEPGAATFTDVVKNYDYSPMGQITKIEYGNGAVTVNTYDSAQMYRLTKKLSTAGGKNVQDIAYTFDAVGNITKVVDTSMGVVEQKTILPKGDVNGDQVIDAEDLKCAMLAVSWYNTGQKSGLKPSCLKRGNYLYADMDCNKKLDTTDLRVVNYLSLGKPLPLKIDADQDGIHNGCEPLSPTVVKYISSTAKTADFTYDDLHRLLTAKVTGAATTPNVNHTYKYDALGNMTYSTMLGDMTYGETVESPYANPHAVTQSGVLGTFYSKKFLYNVNGEIIDDSKQTLTWDYNGRLLSSLKLGKTTTFAYDHTGQRIKKNNDKYLWDNYEIEDGGKVVKHIADATVETLNGINSDYYSLDDHLSSASVLLDATGNISQILDYYPYGGSRINKQFGTFDEKRKFTGHELDDETALYYANARYYNSDLGRFYSLDPAALTDYMRFLSDPQQLNFYAYARNNPMKYTDPSGSIIDPTDAVAGFCGPFAPACFGVKEVIEFTLIATWAASQTIDQTPSKGGDHTEYPRYEQKFDKTFTTFPKYTEESHGPFTTPKEENSGPNIYTTPRYKPDVNFNILNSTTWGEVPNSVKDQVPASWGRGKPSGNGKGWRWSNPENSNQIIRYGKGNPNAEDEYLKSDYVKWTGKDGQFRDKDGNMSDRDSTEAHISVDKFKHKDI